MALDLTARERTIFAVCVVTIAAYATHSFLYKPMRSKRDEMSGKREILQKQLNRDLRLIRDGKNHQPEYDAALEKFRQKGSDEEVMSNMISDIERVSGQFKIRLVEMKPQKVRKVDFYNLFSLSVTFEGPLSEIVRFSYALQQEPYLFGVEELRMDKNFVRAGDLQCQMVLSRIGFSDK